MNPTLVIFIVSSTIVTLASSVSLSSLRERGDHYGSIEKNADLTLDEDYIEDYLEEDDEDDVPHYPNLHQKEEFPEPEPGTPNPCTAFCYSSSNKCCGYSSSHWGSICKSGKSQSPINLPLCQVKSSLPNKELFLDGDLYKGKFSLENDGHTVIARFLEKDKVVELTTSSSSDGGRGGFYTLDSVRFRWGKEDAWGGAEHCVKAASSSSGNGTEPCVREAMEVQFLHYKSDKPSLDKALGSNQKDAVLIISMLLRVVNGSSSSNSKGNRSEITHPPIYPVLNPLLKQLDYISEFGSNVTVKSTLDFTSWLSYPNVASTYYGSMTTPSCRQVVKWVVLQQPMSVKLGDAAAFKGIKGIGDKAVRRNRRPVQKRNKREVGCVVFGVLNGE